MDKKTIAIQEATTTTIRIKRTSIFPRKYHFKGTACIEIYVSALAREQKGRCVQIKLAWRRKEFLARHPSGNQAPATAPTHSTSSASFDHRTPEMTERTPRLLWLVETENQRRCSPPLLSRVTDSSGEAPQVPLEAEPDSEAHRNRRRTSSVVTACANRILRGRPPNA